MRYRWSITELKRWKIISTEGKKILATVIKGPHSPLDAIGDAVYIQHSDQTIDAGGNIFQAYAVTRHSGQLDAVIVKRESGTGIYSLVAIFSQAQYGKNGLPSVQVKGNHLVVILASRQPDDSTLPEEWLVL